jgi:hypothetical protein
MAVIFNEYEYAEKLLINGFKNNIDWRDLLILAKYYRYKGLKKSQIKKNIVTFYKKYCSNYNEVIMGGKIDNAIKKSEKQSLKILPDVFITEKEIEKIRSAKYYKYEKILFVMLVLSRANKIAYKSSSTRYYINQKFSDILKLAKVYVNKTESDKIKHELHKLGMITAPEMNRMSEYNKGEIQELLYAYEKSSPSITVTNLEDIVSFYPQVCIVCGNVVEQKKRRKSELCNACYQEKRTKLKRESAKKKYYESF